MLLPDSPPPRKAMTSIPTHLCFDRNTCTKSLVKVVRRRGSETARSMPVFGDHDKVAGTVLLDVRFCSMPGRLAISMEGAFIYLSQE
ncbi:hypothetical protein A0H81_12636 [Grifola frondosa]|uniref:Uncharacterized protein n=1 Tax=Grifola frondosa TaxID=5627 RepID=A0A1C7LTE8_GRIFR|nr:hypothetical protein A0H81_12636 [Grifola frondosa]